jgi:integrase
MGEKLPLVAGYGRLLGNLRLEALATFRVMRRTLGTDMQKHGTLKDVLGALRHASIQTTGDVYVETRESSVQAAMDSRTGKTLKYRGNIAAP